MKLALALVLIVGPVMLGYVVGEPRWTSPPGSFRRSCAGKVSQSALLQYAIALACVVSFTLGLLLLVIASGGG